MIEVALHSIGIMACSNVPSCMKPFIVSRNLIGQFVLPKVLHPLDDSTLLHDRGADTLQTGHRVSLAQSSHYQGHFIIDHSVLLADMLSLREQGDSCHDCEVWHAWCLLRFLESCKKCQHIFSRMREIS